MSLALSPSARAKIRRIVAAGILAAVATAAGVGSAVARAGYSEAELRSVETPTETKIRELREQEINQLRIALGRRLAQNRQADLYYRLSEIYLEAYRSTFLLEGRVHEKRLDKGREDKFIDRSNSKPYLSAGIKACKEVLKLGLPYNRLDKVYYFLGFYNGELGQKKDSRKSFEILVTKFPSSEFVGEGYRELGDAAFGDTQFRKAADYYERAVQKAGADQKPRLLHKLAWAYYRTKQYDRAVDTMKSAITGATNSGERLLSLKEEALRDMAVFMTETGRVEEAIKYFHEVAGDQSFYPRALERLGKQYERNVEPAKATQVYQSLLKTHPDSEAGFRVLAKLVDLDLRRGKYMDAVKRLQSAQILTGGDSDTQTAAQNLKAMVRRTATEHHEKYRKNKGRGELDIAEAYYTVYLNRFLSQDDPRAETPEIQMYLAEVKRESGKAAEASALYRKVVDSRDKRYAKEAGALWTASLAEAIRKSGAAKGTEPSPMERDFIEAADQLQEALGETTEGREAALKAAQVLAGYRSTHQDAIKRVRVILERWPRSSQALLGARLWVQLLVDDQSEDLKDVVRELSQNSKLMAADQESNQGKLRAALLEQETRLRIGAIAKEEKEKDWDAAAEGYEQFAKDTQDRELAEKALANAVSSHLKDESPEQADRVLAQWLKRYPKSEKAVEAGRGLATGYLIQGEFAKAAQLFERLGSDGGDGASLETAARIHDGIQQQQQAQKLWVRYLDTYKNAPNRFAVALALARSQDRAHLDSEAGSAYRFCLAGSAELEAECGARLGDLFLRNKDFVKARETFQRASKAKTGASPFVGYARFKLAELLEQEARLDELALPEAALKKALNQRLAFLETLSRSYQSAVEAGGPWAVAALHRLASWVARFAEDVDSIAPPAGADGASIAQFRKGLESVSAPLRKKAADTWADAYSKAIAAEAYSPMVPEIADRLADVRHPGIFRSQGPQGKFRIAGVPADGGSGAMNKTRERLSRNPQDSQAWVDYGNLLWGSGKPALARIAYDRALALNAKNAAALNNRGVVKISTDGEDDWSAAAEASQLFLEALKQDEFFSTAKMNRATLLNYYRMFAKAKPLWDQVIAKAAGVDTFDGLGVALQGTGKLSEAEAAIRKATDQGASGSRFAVLYQDAARAAMRGPAGAEACLSKLDDLDLGSLQGFEKQSAESLRRTCAQWKTRK